MKSVCWHVKDGAFAMAGSREYGCEQGEVEPWISGECGCCFHFVIEVDSANGRRTADIE
jgi:hypothetical protein